MKQFSEEHFWKTSRQQTQENSTFKPLEGKNMSHTFLEVEAVLEPLL